MLALMMASFGGCVVDGGSWWDPNADDAHDASLWVEPSEVPAGETAWISIYDDGGEIDEYAVEEVRSLGDFDVVEWNQLDGRIDVIVDVAGYAEGEQLLAVELFMESYYASFWAE